MKLKKYELVRAIDKVKSVVQKNPQIPALGGVLVKEGYAIAANGEMTIQVKLEGTEDESFIIPMKAFDLIKNLPEGDVEITCDDKDVVTIQMEKIKNSYQSFPAESFMYDKTETGKEEGIVLPGALLMEAISHALYAAADKSPGRPELEGIYLEGDGDNLNLAATDGHVMCWDQINAVSGVSGLKLIVPKTAAKKLTSMGMDDDVTLSYDANGAIFKTDTYLIRTRIRNGKFVPYQKMFVNMENYAIVNREELIGAIDRPGGRLRYEGSGPSGKIERYDKMRGTLYVDGRKLGDIEELDFPIKPAQLSKTEKIGQSLEIPKEITMEFQARVTPRLLLTLATGMSISNNWMKMHNGIMERKVQIRKARKTKSRKRVRKESKDGKGNRKDTDGDRVCDKES